MTKEHTSTLQLMMKEHTAAPQLAMEECTSVLQLATKEHLGTTARGGGGIPAGMERVWRERMRVNRAGVTIKGTDSRSRAGNYTGYVHLLQSIVGPVRSGGPLDIP